MRRLLPYLSGTFIAGLSGFSITGLLVLTQHALAAASPIA